MPTPETPKIKPVPVRKLWELHRLFVAAVRTNFTYFDDAVQDQVIAEHSPRHLFLAAIHPRRIILTAWRDGQLIGYAIGSVPSNGDGQLYWLYVVPTSRGGNTGLSLLSRMLRRQRELGADSVSLATYDHRRYYERQGFEFIDKRDVDGLMMDIMRYPLT